MGTEEEGILSLAGQRPYVAFGDIVVYAVTPVIRISEDLLPKLVEIPDGLLHQLATWRMVVGKQHIHFLATHTFTPHRFRHGGCLAWRTDY